MKYRNARWSGVIAAAFLALGSHVAMAQPAGMPPHGPGPGAGIEIEHVLAPLKAQLNLNTSQQGMWDSAVASSKAARQTLRTNMDQVHTVLNAELAKAEPDLAAVAAAADTAQANSQTVRKQARDQWLSLYATFTPDQKAVVKTAIQARVARMEAFREKMKERIQSRMQQGTTAN
jgi:Spy/CpxP family protein refolding chaperone